MKTASASARRTSLTIALGVLALAALACGFSVGTTPPAAGPTPRAAPTPTAVPPTPFVVPADACFAGIIPGQTTVEQLISAFGQPALAIEKDGLQTLGYPSFIPNQYNVFVIADGRVTLIGMQLDPSVFTLSQLTNLIGQPDMVTYSMYLQGTRTYLYPQQGLAFIVEPEADLVFYQECIVPMSLEQYLASWGAELPMENPFNE